MVFNISPTEYDFHEFSILVTFNPGFKKKIKFHGKKINDGVLESFNLERNLQK